MSDFMVNNLWPGLIAWALLYISDYYYTLVCARLYRNGVNQKIVFEGSFELTPYFQRDIDALNFFSLRFVAALLLGGTWLAIIWALTVPDDRALYECVLGAMIGGELVIHIRHARNFFLFRAIVGGEPVSGRIEYPRPVTLRLSAVELLSFAVALALLFVFTRSWFLLGGALACLLTSVKHFRLAKNSQASLSAPTQGENAAIQTQ
jgi:hypothetical protein